MSIHEKIQQALEIIDQALNVNNVTHMFGLFSGGHDSLCATHVASKHPAFNSAVHINTTIGIPETRKFVQNVSQNYQWKLKEYRPPVSYRDIVLEHGFPGPGGHRFMYARLKERCIRQLVRDHKINRYDRIALITGVRLSESVRRMGHVQAIQREGAQLWIAPILDWSDEDKNLYMRHENLPRNPVVDAICMSGECLCGAFAHREERAELKYNFPNVEAEISSLENEALKRGVHAKWGTRPPGKKGSRKRSKGGMLCTSCNTKSMEYDL